MAKEVRPGWHQQGIDMGLRKEGSSCGTCWGYGIWAIGDPVPMGPSDAKGGMPRKECPECGEGKEAPAKGD